MSVTFFLSAAPRECGNTQTPSLVQGRLSKFRKVNLEIPGKRVCKRSHIPKGGGIWNKCCSLWDGPRLSSVQKTSVSRFHGDRNPACTAALCRCLRAPVGSCARSTSEPRRFRQRSCLIRTLVGTEQTFCSVAPRLSLQTMQQSRGSPETSTRPHHQATPGGSDHKRQQERVERSLLLLLMV